MYTHEMLEQIVKPITATNDNILMLNIIDDWISVSKGECSISILDANYESYIHWFEAIPSNQDTLASLIKDIYYFNLGIIDSVVLAPRLEKLYQASVDKCANI